MQITVKILNGQEVRLEVGEICFKISFRKHLLHRTKPQEKQEKLSISSVHSLLVLFASQVPTRFPRNFPRSNTKEILL